MTERRESPDRDLKKSSKCKPQNPKPIALTTPLRKKHRLNLEKRKKPYDDNYQKRYDRRKIFNIEDQDGGSVESQLLSSLAHCSLLVETIVQY